MVDCFQEAANWLHGQREKFLTSPVTVKRGAIEISLNATVTSVEQTFETANGFSETWWSRDFIIGRAKYDFGSGAVDPQQGDQIRFDPGTGVTYVYEAMNRGGEPVFRDSDDFKNAIRIHTKEVANVVAGSEIVRPSATENDAWPGQNDPLKIDDPITQPTVPTDMLQIGPGADRFDEQIWQCTNPATLYIAKSAEVWIWAQANGSGLDVRLRIDGEWTSIVQQALILSGGAWNKIEPFAFSNPTEFSDIAIGVAGTVLTNAFIIDVIYVNLIGLTKVS